MKTFKALYIDQGIIKAGEFPVEPTRCDEHPDYPYDYPCHVCQAEAAAYSVALASAKANAVECEDQDGAGKMIAVRAPYAGNNFIFPLPSGWDYRVEERKIGGRSVKDKNGIAYDYETYTEAVAKLYRTDEQKPLIELAKTIIVNEGNMSNDRLDLLKRHGLNPLDLDLRILDAMEEYAASRISELEAENKRLREEIENQQIEIVKKDEQIDSERWIPVTERLPEEVAQNVLVHLSDGTILTGRLWANGWSAFFSDGECEVTERDVTHWQPLPQPPKEQ